MAASDCCRFFESLEASSGFANVTWTLEAVHVPGLGYQTAKFHVIHWRTRTELLAARRVKSTAQNIKAEAQ